MSPRQIFNGFLVFAALFLGVANAHAQTGADVAAKTRKEIIDAAELNEIRSLAADALYEEAIVRATIAIEKTAQPDKELFYLRGYARHYLSRYEKSIEDVKDLGDYKPVGKWPTASAIVRYCQRCIAARPPNKHLLQLENGTWIHIYYGEENEFTRNATRDAAQGFQAASQFFGVKTNDVSIFLFTEAEYDQFAAFRQASLNRAGTPWVQVFYSYGSLVMSQKNALGKVLAADTPRMLEFVTHEFSHLLVAQIVGRYPADSPSWMIEGIANVGASTVLPKMIETNDKGMRSWLKQGAIFSLEEMTVPEKWGIAVEKTFVQGEKGSPYGQGLQMTVYLQIRLARAGKSDFLMDVRRLKSFDLALKENLGLTPDQFYDGWLRSLQEADAS